MVIPTHDEAEWATRKKRIDPKLDAAGWRLPRVSRGVVEVFRSEEEEADAGPADYALWLDQQIATVVEAKQVSLGPVGCVRAGLRAPITKSQPGSRARAYISLQRRYSDTDENHVDRGAGNSDDGQHAAAASCPSGRGGRISPTGPDPQTPRRAITAGAAVDPPAVPLDDDVSAGSAPGWAQAHSLSLVGVRSGSLRSVLVVGSGHR